MNTALLKETFEIARPIAVDIVSKMYENLFRDHPEARNLFKGTNFFNQKKVVANAVAYVIDNLDKTEQITEALEDMGARHVDYGTEDEHYDWVGAALIEALKFYLQDEWSSEIEETWSGAYGFISSAMKAGAAKKRGDSPTKADKSSKSAKDAEQSADADNSSQKETPTSEDSNQENNVVNLDVAKISYNISYELNHEVKDLIQGYAKEIFEKKVRQEFEEAFKRLETETTSESITEMLKRA